MFVFLAAHAPVIGFALIALGVVVVVADAVWNDLKARREINRRLRHRPF